MTDVVEPGTAQPGTDVVPVEAEHPVATEPESHAHAHPGPKQYVLIAIILVVLTAIEVAVSYLDGDVNSNILIFVLFFLAATKFFIVAAFYMHMKQDSPVFRRLFLVGLIGASIVYGIVVLVFSSTVLRR